MDCGITRCYNYDKECFFKTILVKKPDPKTGCSYFRKMKKLEKPELDENGNKIRKTRADKGQKREKKEKKGKKRKKEENSLQEIM